MAALYASTFFTYDSSMYANNVASPNIAAKDFSIVNLTGSALTMTVLNKTAWREFDDVKFTHSINIGDSIADRNNMKIHMHNESVIPPRGLGFYIALQAQIISIANFYTMTLRLALRNYTIPGIA